MTLALVLWFAAINTAAFAVFAADKRAAVRAARRVPERALLGLAALGGWPAMLLATGRLRHKTRKEPFRTLLRLIAAVEVLAASGLLALRAGLF